jgi:hypothetical protein
MLGVSKLEVGKHTILLHYHNHAFLFVIRGGFVTFFETVSLYERLA